MPGAVACTVSLLQGSRLGLHGLSPSFPVAAGAVPHYTVVVIVTATVVATAILTVVIG